ncbi:Charged multivesicular body protein 4b [Galemys pyrenaicus]|uniref:Charged multivesicular body protein 4b n=1 Tax=Galemys pyrenaicus TaxID=202257 RepID=A0A8J6DTI6_GALPY|nr:Charged multivesicular body protein 4b [Galemys pyrenaicus]
MSVFGKLFGAGGGKAGKGGPTPQEAIQRLRDTEEMLSKKQEFLEKKIEQELTAAKKHGTKNKRGETAQSSRNPLRLPGPGLHLR